MAETWIAEVKADVEARLKKDLKTWDEGLAKMEEDLEMGAWGDVHGGELPMGLVRAARKEEISYMEGRNTWTLRPI